MNHHAIPDIQSLQQQRAELFEQMEAISQGAEGRDLTAKEETRFFKLEQDIKALDADIAAAKQAQDRRAATADPSRVPPPGSHVDAAGVLPAGFGLGQAWGPHDGPQAPDPGRLSFRTADGRIVHALGPSDPWPIPEQDRAIAAELGGGLSLGRAIRASVTGDWSGAQAEREYFVSAGPHQLNDFTRGGALVPPAVSAEIIDLARARAQVMNAGARTLPMPTATLSLARILKDPEPSWRGEGQPVADTESTFGAIMLSARTLAAILVVSIELLEDSANIDALLQQQLAEAFALSFDKAALFGSGIGPEPTGLANRTTQLLPWNAPLENFRPFSQARGQLLMVNTDEAGISVLYPASVASHIDQFTDSTGQPLRPPEGWTSMRRLVTNQIPTDWEAEPPETTAFAGDFSNLLLGLRTDLTIEATRVGSTTDHNAFREMKVLIRAYLRGDWGVMRENHFIRIEGLQLAELNGNGE